MQKKDDKVGNEAANKEERQSKKGEQEKEMEIGSKKKTTTKISPNFGFCACVKNKRACLITPD